VVTKLKAINLSTPQSTEKHHKKKNILNIHQVRLLAQFSHVFVGKATVISQNYFARQCYKMSDTRSLLKSGSEKQSLFFSLK
jgi:hypothetical protein